MNGVITLRKGKTSLSPAAMGTHLDSTTHGASRNAGFIRQSEMPHGRCRINPAFRRWYRDAPKRWGSCALLTRTDLLRLSRRRRPAGRCRRLRFERDIVDHLGYSLDVRSQLGCFAFLVLGVNEPAELNNAIECL